MIPIFEICKVDTCSVRITGLEQEDKQYSSELIEQYGGFRYSDTVTINILIPINSKNEKIDEHILYDINEHSEENIDESILKFNLDGLHKIIHIILPTKEWVESYKELYPNDTYSTYYYYNLGNIYKNNEELVKLAELININSENTTTLFKSEQLTFNTCNIKKCMHGYISEYLNSITNSNCTKLDNEFVRNKDIIWMTWHAINYLNDLGKHFEAQELVEKLTGCLGLCGQINKNKLNKRTYDCGCL